MCVHTSIPINLFYPLNGQGSDISLLSFILTVLKGSCQLTSAVFKVVACHILKRVLMATSLNFST